MISAEYKTVPLFKGLAAIMDINVDSRLPILVFGGPYSNFQALEAMQAIAARHRIPPSQIICTGDLVAYCAEPEETAVACRDWGIHIIQGNCEEQIAANADNCGCGFEDGTSCSVLSNSWYAYAQSQISDKTRSWMAGLPKVLRFDLFGKRCSVIHGAYDEINRFIFPSTAANEKCLQLSEAQADIMIAGHSGIPFIEQTDQGIWFNPGVIGMPANDGTTDGWYGIIDATSEGIKFSTHRLQYNSGLAAERLSVKGFADPYAKSLVSGIWPSDDMLPNYEKSVAGKIINKNSLIAFNSEDINFCS